MEPILPTDEQRACMEFLVYVGNSSDVKMYVMEKYNEDISLPDIYKVMESHGSPGKQNIV
jgi:hypothetical protein